GVFDPRNALVDWLAKRAARRLRRNDFYAWPAVGVAGGLGGWHGRMDGRGGVLFGGLRGAAFERSLGRRKLGPARQDGPAAALAGAVARRDQRRGVVRGIFLRQ